MPSLQSLTKARLRDALLRTQDMPTGYSPEQSGLGARTTRAICNAHYNTTALRQASVVYTKSTYGPFVLEKISTYHDANRTLDESIRAAGTCRRWTERDGTVVHVAPLSFPRIGDQTLALRFTLGGVEAPVIYWRRGNVIGQISESSPIVGADTDLLLRLARKADRRLVLSLGSTSPGA